MMRSKPPHRFIHLLNVAQRRVQRWSADGVQTMTATQAGVIFFLDQTQGSALSDIGRVLALNPSSMTGLIDRMTAAGLVERRADQHDGRVVRIFLTPFGASARSEAKRQVAEINRRLVEGFAEKDLDIVARWLGQAADRFSEEKTSD